MLEAMLRGDVHGVPPEYTMPWRRSSFDNRCRTRIRSARASSRARTRSRNPETNRRCAAPTKSDCRKPPSTDFGSTPSQKTSTRLLAPPRTDPDTLT
jgi:hypothetical protein